MGPEGQDVEVGQQMFQSFFLWERWGACIATCYQTVSVFKDGDDGLMFPWRPQCGEECSIGVNLSGLDCCDKLLACYTRGEKFFLRSIG